MYLTQTGIHLVIQKRTGPLTACNSENLIILFARLPFHIHLPLSQGCSFQPFRILQQDGSPL